MKKFMYHNKYMQAILPYTLMWLFAYLISIWVNPNPFGDWFSIPLIITLLGIFIISLTNTLDSIFNFR